MAASGVPASAEGRLPCQNFRAVSEAGVTARAGGRISKAMGPEGHTVRRAGRVISPHPVQGRDVGGSPAAPGLRARQPVSCGVARVLFARGQRPARPLVRRKFRAEAFRRPRSPRPFIHSVVSLSPRRLRRNGPADPVPPPPPLTDVLNQGGTAMAFLIRGKSRTSKRGSRA